MALIKLWSNQHENVLKEIEKNGRYIAKKEYIGKDLQEHSNLVLEVYDWYVGKLSKTYPKPSDVTYPIWVSFRKDTTMLLSPDRAILELEVEEDIIMPIDISKWGMILNYSYIPKDAEDEKNHKDILKFYGVSDAKAYMSQFYPDIKREIIKSWDNLFNESIVINNKDKYGTLWEVKREWLKA